MISENQSAFIPGRLITDNALIAFECIHAIQHDNSTSSKFCAVKLDLAKAYDRVDWSYLEHAMEKLGFHHTWIKWIMECVTTVCYTVRFNGVLLNTIQPTRGLRQGNPLSPYLFLFVADGLSRVLQHGNGISSVQGFNVCRRAPTVSHLLFADDGLLFFRAAVAQTDLVKKALQRYCKGMGQLINYEKCLVLFNKGQDVQVINMVNNQLGIHRETFEAKYLGLPTPEGRLKVDRFDALSDRLMKGAVLGMKDYFPLHARMS